MANPWKFEQAHAQALAALAEQAARVEYQEPPRPQKAQALSAPEFPQQQEGSIHLIKNSLNGGELSPELGARFDQQRYQSGCHTLLNMIPLPWGGVRKRPGLSFVRYAAREDPEAATRLIPFVFSQDQSRVLELSAAPGQGRADLRVLDSSGEILFTRAAFLPCAASALAEITYCQSADVIFLAHSSLPPCKIMRYADNDWRFESISWLPSIEAPQWRNVFASGVWPDGEQRRVHYEYVCTAIDGETGQESATSGVWHVYWTAPLSQSWFVSLQIRPVPGASEYRVYRKSAGVFGFVGMVDEPSYENGEDFYAFEDRNVEPDVADTPPRDRNPFAGEGDYPSLVFLHQQRLGFAATKRHPLTVWLSQSGNYESMAASIPPDADDAIEATLAAPEANSIVWAMPDRNGLLMATQGGVWLMAPSEGAALTPSDLSFQPQCNLGAQEGLAPVRGPAGLIFAQRGGRAVRDLGYSFQQDRYQAADLSILARHIFTGRHIRSWAWQQEPWSVLWMVLSDGSMAGLTWLAEHEIMAWHRHETEGQVEQACAIPLPDGSSAVFFTILRNGRRAIEKFDSAGDFSAQTRLVDGPEKKPFSARCVPCLPEQQLRENSSFMMLRKINSIKARVRKSCPFRARVISQDHTPSPLVSVPARPEGIGFTTEAVWSATLGAGFREDARLELVLDGPEPVAICSLLINAEYGDMSGSQGA